MLTKGAFYSKHDSKRDLVSNCFERTFSIMRSALAAVDAMQASSFDKLCAVTRMLTTFQLSFNGPLLRANATMALPDEEQQRSVRLRRDQMERRLANLLVDGMAEGSVRPLDPSAVSLLLMAAIDTASGVPRWEPTVTSATVGQLYIRRAFLGLLP